MRSPTCSSPARVRQTSAAIACATLFLSLTQFLAAQSPARNLATTYLGNDGEERAQGVCLLGNGDVVVCGETCSEFRSSYTPTGSAPTTSCTAPPQVGPWPAPQQAPACDTINGPLSGSGVPTDGYVAVRSSDLTQVKYWSFIRGDDDDRAYAVAPGSNNTIWVCGFTDSTITTTAPVAFPFVTSGIAPIPSVYGA